jgi:hypothetical protein
MIKVDNVKSTKEVEVTASRSDKPNNKEVVSNQFSVDYNNRFIKEIVYHDETFVGMFNRLCDEYSFEIKREYEFNLLKLTYEEVRSKTGLYQAFQKKLKSFIDNKIIGVR